MIKMVAFDFDGTLADSVDFCIENFHRVFERFLKGNVPTHEDIFRCFGMNEPGVIRHFMGAESHEAEDLYFEFHSKLHPQECPEAYEGVRGLLDFLKNQGFMLTVLTGRWNRTCDFSMDFLQLKEYFQRYYYGEMLNTDKSRQMLNLAEDFQLAKDEILYIGDTVSDVESCRRAGIKCLSAAWTSTSRIADLEKANPGLVFTSVDAMQKYIAANYCA